MYTRKSNENRKELKKIVFKYATENKKIKRKKNKE
jgi:hypothetical protein